MGNVDEHVMTSASSWAEGIKKYQTQKLQAPYRDEPTPMPHYVTRKFKSREEAAVNPILQKFREPEIENTLRQAEAGAVTRTLNRAWDKQLLREQHFDIITQQPRRGHVHEVEYKQRLKPPSLVTANHVGYNIISTEGLDQHHWAPPDKRPPRLATPPRKEPFLTAVNRPREFDILNNRYREYHQERSKWEMDQARSAIVDKYWETHDFDVVSCSYVDKDKEAYYQRRIKEMLLTQGTNAINKLPPTLAASESLMYDICTGVVRDPGRLQKKIEAERAALEGRAGKINSEEQMRVRGEMAQAQELARKNARISHGRYLDVTARGFDILTNASFDRHGPPPPPATRPRKTFWAFREELRSDPPRAGNGGAGRPPPAARPATQGRPAAEASGGRAPPTAGSGQGGGAAAPAVQAGAGSRAGSRQGTSLSGARIRSGGFARRPHSSALE